MPGSTTQPSSSSSSGQRCIALIEEFMGSTLTHLSVGRFRWEGEVDPEAFGELLVSLDDRVIVLRGARGGGDTVTCEELESAPVPEEGSEDGWFIDHVAFGASLVGRQLTSVMPMVSQFGLVAGVRLEFQGEGLFFLSQADEHYLLALGQADQTRRLGFTIGTLPTTSTRS